MNLSFRKAPKICDCFDQEKFIEVGDKGEGLRGVQLAGAASLIG
jgi:hypothetical protein